MKPNLSVPNFTDTDFTAHGADIANLYKRLADVTTDAEQEALKAQKLFMKGTYFRFNTGTKDAQGDYVDPINLADWQGMKALEAETTAYLRTTDGIKLVKDCAKKLGAR